MRKLKKIISLTLATTMLTGTMLTTHIMANENEVQQDTTDYLVVTNSDNALKKANSISIDSEEIMKINSKKVISKMTVDTDDTSHLKSIDGVVEIEKDIVISGNSNESANSTSNNDVLDCLFKDVKTKDINQWNLQSLGVDSISTSPNGEKVKVELLDSGVSWSNDIDVKYRENLIEDDIGINPLYEDYSQHGTGMAGVICAKDNGKGITGVNPNVDLYSVRALDDNIQAPLSRIIQGIYWGIDNDMDIINMSFGTNTNSSILRDAIKQAYQKGIVLVSASGNNNEDGVQYPAAYPEVISVGSQSANGEISDFTSVGDNLDVVAPGENIESTGIFGTINGSDGTSIATAQVTGVASLILEKDKSKTPDFVRDLILKSSKKISDKGVVTGAVDGEYALSIYDDFAKNYTETNTVKEYANPNDIEEYNTDGYVKGLWKSAQHIETAQVAGSDLASGNNLKLIVAGARAADYASVDGFELYKVTSALHGGGNYVANLRCAWKFVCEFKKSKNIDTAWDKASVFAEKLKAYQSSSTTAEVIDEMLSVFGSLEIVDYSKTFNVSDNLKSDCLYKAIGLCMHMVADTFAHRTQVPTSYKNKFTDDRVVKNASSFTMTDSLKKQLIKECQTNTVSKSHRYRQYLSASVSYGVVEFRDIKKFSPGYYKNPMELYFSDLYEDNPNFYSRRYEEAMCACEQLSYNGYIDCDICVLMPTINDAGTSVKLWDYKRYCQMTNYDTDFMTDKEWAVCTSFPKDVN